MAFGETSNSGCNNDLPHKKRYIRHQTSTVPRSFFDSNAIFLFELYVRFVECFLAIYYLDKFANGSDL